MKHILCVCLSLGLSGCSDSRRDDDPVENCCRKQDGVHIEDPVARQADRVERLADLADEISIVARHSMTEGKPSLEVMTKDLTDRDQAALEAFYKPDSKVYPEDCLILGGFGEAGLFFVILNLD